MRSTNQPSIIAATLLGLFWCLSVAGGVSTVHGDEPKPAFGVFSAAGDHQVAKTLNEVLNGGETKHATATFSSLKDAVNSDAKVLILVMPLTGTTYPEDIVQGLKQKKVIGIGCGAAQIFGHLALEINGGACAHFRNNVPSIQVQKSLLLGKKWETRAITPYNGSPPSDNFGMFIPSHSEMRQFVDVIARSTGSENYAPIVRQNNYVMIGLSAGPRSWSDNYRALVRDVALTVLKQAKQPFATAQFLVLEPGTRDFSLGKGGSTKELFDKKFYFQFTKPTRISATLVHIGSKNMMMIFRGQTGGLHGTRMDAKNGEPLTIVCEITTDDLKSIGDNYWSLGVTNFDRNSASACVLSVQYEVDKQERE